MEQTALLLKVGGMIRISNDLKFETAAARRSITDKHTRKLLLAVCYERHLPQERAASQLNGRLALTHLELNSALVNQ